MSDYLKTDHRMTKEQEAHLERVKSEFCELVDEKYRAGQREHGGDLWNNKLTILIDLAIDEAIDQVVYLLTIRDEIRKRV